MTKIIGLTGGIGSGKTLVANYLKERGIPVYIADDEARSLMSGKEVVDAVEKAFGSEVVAEGYIDRKKLASIVFQDPEKLTLLNSIVHPIVRNHFMEWVDSHQDKPLVIKEAAILFESGSDADCDAVITVNAPLEVRISRVMERDLSTREEIENRMQAQMSDEQKVERSDFVITNINKEDTYVQVDEILKKLQDI